MVDGLRESGLGLYRPVPKQRAMHDLGASCRLRLLMAGNQQGKSTAGSAETAMHLTGLYPPGWKGHRFQKPIRAWAAGDTTVTTRDIVQRKLLGEPGQLGTGMIPKSLILDIVAARGIGETADFVTIRHALGGTSYLAFRTYEQGRRKWQGETLDWIWFDEEPPNDIWTEGLARLSSTSGLALITFTPMLGLSDVVREFYPNPQSSDRGLVQMQLEDATHLSDPAREQILSLYPPHEREARVRGIPMLGSGRIFTVPESDLEVNPADLRPAPWWREIIGLDLGAGDHPTAWSRLLHDPEADRIWVTDVYRSRDPVLAIHASAIVLTYKQAPVAWPKDALRKDVTAGQPMAALYRKHGCSMLVDHAQFEDGSVSVEAGVQEMDERMRTGRFRVARHLLPFWDEYRTYHRKDGLIVPEHDDVLCSVRYAMMMLRYARTLSGRGPRIEDPIAYDPFHRGVQAL
jgi:phage terminase large subunit-like protein